VSIFIWLLCYFREALRNAFKSKYTVWNVC